MTDRAALYCVCFAFAVGVEETGAGCWDCVRPYAPIITGQGSLLWGCGAMAARLLCKQRAESSSLSVSMCEKRYGGCSRVVQATDCGSVYASSILAIRPNFEETMKEIIMETDYPGLRSTHSGALPAGEGKGL